MRSKVHIFGVGIDPVTKEDVLARIREALETGRPCLVTHVHVMGMNLAYRTPWLVEFFNRADVVYCDGYGVRVGAWLLGRRLPARFTLADWMHELVDVVAASGRSVYFLGNPPGVAARAAAALAAEHDGLRIAGAHDGFFDPAPGGAENEAVLRDIRAARPDLLLVGMGMPRQEAWVRDNRAQLDGISIMTVGGVFEYWGGSLTRSPRWMTENGLEWLALTLQAPRRYWKRHLVGNPIFFARVIKERFSEKANGRMGE
ncbi:MAG TPA: WecB/TagA/CpsF family glycosyltransferase [Anaerolineales bacterium]|nr:WecB/TagA/CpsF family glycosyltransferase [Anaerolineales bacterium]